MSETITAASLTVIINKLSDAYPTAETLIDQAINMIVSASKGRLTIAVLTGIAGSKTGSYTQAEKGAILYLASLLYSQIYATSGGSSKNMGLQGVSLGQSSSSTSTGTSGVQAIAEALAGQLIIADTTAGSPPIWVSHDPIPT